MPETTMRTSESDELYVGYLPVPPRQRRFLRLWAPIIVVAFAVFGTTWSITFRSPGNGVWDTSKTRTFEGILYETPYPMVCVTDPRSSSGVRTLLLVNQGKHGAATAAAGLNNKAVRVSGYLLERGDRRLLELETNKIESLATEDAKRWSSRLPRLIVEKGRQSLRGEIIDPKCYCGAMKPGEGKTHKECAVLCISGGIPPMFALQAVDAVKLLLLADSQGHALDNRILPYVADDVEITGDVEQWGDLGVFKIDPASIRRK